MENIISDIETYLDYVSQIETKKLFWHTRFVRSSLETEKLMNIELYAAIYFGRGQANWQMIFVANDQAKLWLILPARGYYSYLPLFHMHCTWRKCIAYGSTCLFLMSPKVSDRSSYLLVTWPSESLHGTFRILKLFSQVFSANSNFRQVIGKCNNAHVCPPGPGDMVWSYIKPNIYNGVKWGSVIKSGII